MILRYQLNKCSFFVGIILWLITTSTHETLRVFYNKANLTTIVTRYVSIEIFFLVFSLMILVFDTESFSHTNTNHIISLYFTKIWIFREISVKNETHCYTRLEYMLIDSILFLLRLQSRIGSSIKWYLQFSVTLCRYWTRTRREPCHLYLLSFLDERKNQRKSNLFLSIEKGKRFICIKRCITSVFIVIYYHKTAYRLFEFSVCIMIYGNI
jgi:hypothetical protein